MDASSSLSAEDLAGTKKSMLGSVVSRVSGFFKRTPSAPAEPQQKPYSVPIRVSYLERYTQSVYYMPQTAQTLRPVPQYVVLPYRLLNAYYEYRAFIQTAQGNADKAYQDLEKRLLYINELNDTLVRTAQQMRDAYMQYSSAPTTIVAPRLKPYAAAPTQPQPEAYKTNKLSVKFPESTIPLAKEPVQQITSIASKYSPYESAASTAAENPQFSFNNAPAAPQFKMAAQTTAEPPKFVFGQSTNTNPPANSFQPKTLSETTEKATADTQPTESQKPAVTFAFGTQDRPKFTFGAPAPAPAAEKQANPADNAAGGYFKFNFNFNAAKQQ